jgi:hypothetical protein
LYGLRTEVYQALRCPTCGEGVFVLPRSPLPDPPVPVEKKRGRPIEVAVMDDGPIALADPPPLVVPEIVDDEAPDGLHEHPDAPAPVSVPGGAELEFDLAAEAEAEARRIAARPKPRPVAGSAQGLSSAQRSKSTRGQRPPPAEQARPMIAVAPRRSFADWARANTLPLIFLAVMTLVVGTVFYRFRQKRRQELPQVAELGKTKGLPALDAGDFDTAHRLLSEAAQAVRELGGAYEDSEAITQGAAEASIYVDLIPHPLSDLINEAARARSEQERKDQFNAIYKGRAVILDGNAPQYRILGRSGLNTNRVGRIDTEGIELLKSPKTKDGESSLVFGARLQSLALVDGEWVVQLDPKSVVVMTHWDALKAFGWSLESDENAGEEPQ